MSNVCGFNYIDVTLPDRIAWTGDKPPLDGLAIYTDRSKLGQGTGSIISIMTIAALLRRGFLQSRRQQIW